MSSNQNNYSPLPQGEGLGERASKDDIAIRVQNLSKCYQIYDTPRDRLKQFLVPKLCRSMPAIRKFFPTSHFPLTTYQGQPTPHPPVFYKEFWALKDVSIEVKKGETVGIIGRNGSGKSTLLQLICGTMSPTIGSVQTNGRIAALLELGSGFNPEFTGRENVFMNGAILGLKQEEIEERFDDVASFADIGDFIEQPVKTYSSGMLVRLAFAVNIMSKPEIMIVDEALTVGDMGFQAKCMTALTRIQEGGATVLFVSHDVGAVKSLCSRGVYLEHGTVRAIGKAPDVAEQYIRTMREEMNAETRRFSRVSSGFVAEPAETKAETVQTLEKGGAVLKRSDEFDKRVAAFRYGSGGARITYVELLNMDDEPIQSVEFNQEVKIRIFCAVEEEMELSINFQVLDEKRNNVTASGFVAASRELLLAKNKECYAVTYILKLPLRDGTYSIQTTVVRPVPGNQLPEFIDAVPDSVVFKVNPREVSKVWSAVYLFPEINIEKIEKC